MANGVQYKAISISDVYYSSSTVMLSAESAGVASATNARTISRTAAVTIMSFLTEPPAPPGAVVGVAMYLDVLQIRVSVSSRGSQRPL